jgi:hypothetical protein
VRVKESWTDGDGQISNYKAMYESVSRRLFGILLVGSRDDRSKYEPKAQDGTMGAAAELGVLFSRKEMDGQHCSLGEIGVWRKREIACA